MVRDEFNGFVDRHDIAWELGMALLAVVYVAVGFALDGEAFQSMTPTLEVVELALTIAFAAEFLTRLGASRSRTAYLSGHWIDLVALVPVTRGLRILRVLRLLRLVRAFAGVHRALGHVGSLAEHRGLQVVVLSWLGVMVICTTAIYFAERDVNAAIRSPFDALWWGISTMTTVGYGDVVPATAEGRIAASVLMLLGVGLFSAITAIVTSVLVANRAPSADPIDSIERLARLASTGVVSPTEFAAKRAELLARI
jgi:voltage-gated potassium channel